MNLLGAFMTVLQLQRGTGVLTHAALADRRDDAVDFALDLPETVQARVVDGTLSMGHARALLGGDDIEALAQDVVARGLSVRDTEKLVRDGRARQGTAAAKRNGAGRDADLAALEHQLADLLGLQVRIAHAESGGTLTLGYATLDQLDMVCQRLSGEAL